MSSIRIVLADDHQLVRAGIRALLEQISGVKVVGEAGEGREILNVIQETKPNIALLDIGMSGLNGLDAAAQIRKDFPDVKVIILSMHSTEEYVMQAMKIGVAGYLLKDSATEELEMAVRSVANGEHYLSPFISKQVLTDYRHRLNREEDESVKLTTRQREILQLIAEGKSTREIAELLHISVKTIETHRSQLMDRLDIHDLAGLVRYAIRIGLIST